MTSIEQYWDTRLTNWALWETGGNSVGISSYNGVAVDDMAPRNPPPLVGEALDTDTLLVRLNSVAPDNYVAVRIRYVWSGSFEERCRQARIPKKTIVDRVRSAIFRLDDMDQERRAQMARMRARVAA
jgi:hypothetical protein